SFRESFVVDELIWEDGRVAGIRGHHYGGTEVQERARTVIGADGAGSLIAGMVNALEYNQYPGTSFFHYSYWSGLPVKVCELYIRPDSVTLASPTNNGLPLVGQTRPLAAIDTVRPDIEGAFYALLDTVPELAARVRAGRREDRFFGMIARPNVFRKPYGPG